MRNTRPTLFAMGLLALAFLWLDWSRLLLPAADLAQSPWSSALKVCLVVLAAAIAFRAGGNGHGAADERALKIIFGLIVPADLCFALGLPPVGILLFAVVHVLLVRRNLAGLSEAREAVRARALPLAAGGLAVALVVAVVVRWIYREQGLTPLFTVIGVYVVMLWCSVMAAWTARAIGRFPARSTLQMAVGLTCFFLCDCNVAANLVLPAGSLVRVVTESVTWMFYAPALSLIALSAWRAGETAERAPLAASPAAF